MAQRAQLEPGSSPVYSVSLNDIVVPTDRVRALKPEQAAAIGAAMDADGQYDAITVAERSDGRGFELVDGLHRLEGARLVGWTLIDARIADGGNASLRRQEILSGWARADHDVFDKVAGIKALVDIARAEAGVPDGDLRQLNGRRGGEDDVARCAKSLRWDIAVASDLDISARTVSNYLGLADVFLASDVAVLRLANVADKRAPLEFLAGKSDDIRKAVIERFARGWRGTIADAVAEESGLVRDDDPISRATRATLLEHRKWGSDAKGVEARRNFYNQWIEAFEPDGRIRASRDQKAS